MDELHMIDDENRGYILELMATKLLSLALDEKAQLIGMSATLNVCKPTRYAVSASITNLPERRFIGEMARGKVLHLQVQTGLDRRISCFRQRCLPSFEFL